MAGLDSIKVVGGTFDYERRIRRALRMFPSWVFNAARLSGITVDSSEEMKALIASYRHNDRVLRVYPGIGDQMLVKALGHELMHGADDNFGSPHYFSVQDEWRQLQRDQPYFDMPKYRDEPLEYFADVAVKYFLLGREKLRISHPGEATFLEGRVFPVLQDAFGGQ